MFELRQDTVDRSQTDVEVFGQQQAIHIFRREVADLALLEQGEDLEARQRGFQPDGLEVLGTAHQLASSDWQ